jgi:hypothetical protein
MDENDTRDVREVLLTEGVKFDEAGRADLAQRITARELAQLLDLPGAEDLADIELTDIDAEEMSDYELRFYAQLGDLGPAVAGATTRLIEHWNAGVGTLYFGSSNTGRCQLRLRHAGLYYSMLNIYPQAGEIPFQVLKNRPPFDDATVREELRQRINDAPGVDIPETKLDLYPSFPLTVLADPAAWDVVAGTLDWFISQISHTNNG